MGAWGVAIFSDDTASDIRSRFRDLIADGSTPEEATNTLLKEFGTLDADEEPVFWLSLAATQWKLGRLQDDVKSKALAMIENGTDLARWEDDPKQKKKRAAVLEKLKDQLNSTQPEAKKIPKRVVYDTHLKTGDAVAYRLLSGKYMMLKVCGIHQDMGGRFPVFVVCDWIGDEIPSTEQIEQLPMKKREGTLFKPLTPPDSLIVAPHGKRDGPKNRIEVVAEHLDVQAVRGGSVFIWWKEFDDKIKSFYNYE